jgi:hypothetical protein
MTTALEFLNKVAEVANAIGFHAGVGGVETAGQIISCLYANPDALERFMAEGTELIFDQTISMQNGSLSWHASDGRLVSPSQYRERKGMQQ